MSRAAAIARGVLHHPAARVVGRRLLVAIPLIFLVTFLTFVLLSLAPGGAAYAILGGQATPEKVAQLNRQLGLDDPLMVQYWNWLKAALSGDLGTSVFSGQPVAEAIGQRLPVTISLIVGGLVVMPLIGVTFGIYSAVRGGVAGRLLDGLALVGLALPSFWVAAILISLFAVRFHVFPAVGYVSYGTSPGDWLRSITLPVVALSLVGIATFARFTREAMVDVMASEHIRMAWANGLPARQIIFRYALKNVGIRILTLMGLTTISLLSGTVFVETIFALPGLGSYVVTGALTQDVPVVLGAVLVFTLVIVGVNLVVDLASAWLDPRVRAE